MDFSAYPNRRCSARSRETLLVEDVTWVQAKEGHKHRKPLSNYQTQHRFSLNSASEMWRLNIRVLGATAPCRGQPHQLTCTDCSWLIKRQSIALSRRWGGQFGTLTAPARPKLGRASGPPPAAQHPACLVIPPRLPLSNKFFLLEPSSLL